MSLLDLLTQYKQLYMQWFVKSIFSREIHLPSSDQLWQIPLFELLPNPPGLFFRILPLEEQETSYFAAAERISSFFCSSIRTPRTYNFFPGSVLSPEISRTTIYYHSSYNYANICSSYKIFYSFKLNCRKSKVRVPLFFFLVMLSLTYQLLPSIGVDNVGKDYAT